jgi:hypothetical protein
VRHRVGHEPLDQGVDVTVESGREEQPLRVGRGLGQQFGDIGQEAHVSHLVGLVQHGDLDVVELAGATLDQVGEPARGGHDDLDAAPERVHLTVVRHAADGGLQEDADRAAQRHQRVGDLHGQLARRHQDQGLGVVREGAAALRDAGQQRQPEREGLAGAGLTAAQDVPAGQGVRDGRDLDLERGGDAFPVEHPNEVGVHAQVGEGSLCGGVVYYVNLHCGGFYWGFHGICGVVRRSFENGRKRAGISEGGQENLSTGAHAREWPAAAVSVERRWPAAVKPARTPVARTKARRVNYFDQCTGQRC